MENVALAWRAEFPGQAAAYLQTIIEEKAAQVHENGMSKDGNMRRRGMIPSAVFYVIEQRVPGFFNDPTSVDIFYEIFMGDHRPGRVKSKLHIIDRKKKDE